MPGRKLRYTALGDSIARGIGATKQYGYVYFFRDFLQKKHGDIHLSNRAISGIKSSVLLAQLKFDPITRYAVKNAEVITISIGGNNLLVGARANYYSISDSRANTGVVNFKKDWLKILHEIRQGIKSNAKIYTMTIYNPFKGDDENYKVANNYIHQINAEIRDQTLIANYNYKIADVYNDFKGRVKHGTWKVCVKTHFSEKIRDPHPTDIGHKDISRSHEKIYQ
ncbi:GDSL-type esterase/lipase family protein [Aneurinibacillus terranovensis]|uniref:GDSL-type esterase/lipase family protein n=1 Tax=Aneurinibacillus terranovensis TaxID=278991 RepID=UPI0003F7E45F|nr:GDSL-type esterase/lipase family protein [Aneurinibacillus terranovensis]